jgi:hypothetical protein
MCQSRGTLSSSPGRWARARRARRAQASCVIEALIGRPVRGLLLQNPLALKAPGGHPHRAGSRSKCGGTWGITQEEARESWVR